MNLFVSESCGHGNNKKLINNFDILIKDKVGCISD